MLGESVHCRRDRRSTSSHERYALFLRFCFVEGRTPSDLSAAALAVTEDVVAHRYPEGSATTTPKLCWDPVTGESHPADGTTPF